MELRARKVRVTLLYLLVVGLLIVVTSIYAYTTINRFLSGSGSARDLFGEWVPFLKGERVLGVRVAVLQSEQTADFMASMAGDRPQAARQIRENYLQIAEYWERQMASRNIDVEVISDADLLDGMAAYNVLVLPVVHCMSEAQIDAVKDFLRQRKGVIMTHMSGSRDANGEERSWSLTGDVTGGDLTFSPRQDRSREGRFLFLSGETPLAANRSPAFPLRVHDFDEPIALGIRERRSQMAGVWQDYLLPVAGDPRRDVAVAYGDYMGGRFVWFGFSAQSVASTPEMWATFENLIADATNWLAYRSVIGKGTWPQSRAAASFAIKVQQDLPGAENLAETFFSEGIPAAVLVQPESVAISRAALSQMDESMEVIPFLSISEERIRAGDDMEIAGQLQAGRSEIVEQLRRPVEGFSLLAEPQRESFDRLNRLDFEYLWIVGKYHPAPRLAPVIRDPLFARIKPPVMIYQSSRGDDIMNIDGSSPDRGASFEEIWKRDFDRIQALGTYYGFTLHGERSGARRHQERIRSWLRHVASGDVWIASPAELARWWRQYEMVQLRLVEGPQRLTVMVSNEGRETVEQIRVFIYPPRLPESVDISAERIRTPIPDYTINRRAQRVELLVTDLRRRENRTYYVELNYP